MHNYYFEFGTKFAFKKYILPTKLIFSIILNQNQTLNLYNLNQVWNAARINNVFFL